MRVGLAGILLSVCAAMSAQQTDVVWSENFERYTASAPPERWVDPSDRFRTHTDPADTRNMVYGAQHQSRKQRSVSRRAPGNLPEAGSTSTLSGYTFGVDGGFEFRGRFRRETLESLFGITVVSHQPESHRYRMIALWRSRDDVQATMRVYRFGAEESPHGGVELARSDFTPAADTWYRFVVRTDVQAGAGVIRARFWRDGEPEPQSWTIEAVNAVAANESGRIGLWSENGAAYFDDLTVTAAASPREEADRLAPAIVFYETGEVIANGSSAAFNRDARVDVRAFDGSGIKTLTATLDDSAYVPLAAITAERRHVLRARAADHAGNIAEAQISLVIDKTPPVLRVLQGGQPLPNGLLTRADVTPEIVVTDLTDVAVVATLNDSPLRPGVAISEERQHSLVVTATDAVGWRTALLPILFTIDRTPPAVSITSPSPEQSIATKTVDVTGLTDDAVRVTVNGVAAEVDPAARTFARRNVPLVAGVNPIAVAGADGAGNEGHAALRVHVETRRPPRVAIATPAPNTCTSGSQLVATGTARDAASVRVRIGDGSPVPATITGTDWSATVPLLGEGPSVLSVDASNSHGDLHTASVALLVDRTKPAITLNEGSAPLTTTLFNRAIAPTVRLADADAAASVAMTLNSVPYASGSVVTADGVYLLRVAATDCAGNEGTAEATFTIDRTPPAIASIAPANGATTATRPAIAGTLTETATLVEETAGVSARVEGLAFTFAPSLVEGLNERVFIATDAAGNGSRTAYSVRVKSGSPFVEIVESGSPIAPGALFSRSVVPVVRVSETAVAVAATLNGQPFTSGSTVTADGSYSLEATATDSFGHVSDRASATFRIDRTPPHIDITSPLDRAVIHGETIEVRGTLDPDAVSASINGVPATVNGSTFAATVLLEAGENLISGSAVDRAGNTGHDRVHVLREGGPLAILLTSPPDGMLTNRPTTVVAGHVLQAPPSGRVSVNGIQVAVLADGTFRKADVPLREGENEIVASVTSTDGNTNSVAVQVDADFTPPTLRVTANNTPLTNGARFVASPQIGVEATDNIPAGLVRELTVDGAVVPATTPALGTGGHALTAIARDAAGNETRIDRTFYVGDALNTDACVLSAVDPPAGAATFSEVLTITGRSGGARSVLIDGKAAQVADGSFCGEATLRPGRNEVVIRCADANGNPTDDPPIVLVLHRDTEPIVTISSPAPGTMLTASLLTVTGTVTAGVTGGDVNGVSFTVPLGAQSQEFRASNVALAPGLNTIVARGKTGAGRVGVATTRVTLLNAAPQVSITAPIVGTETGAASIDVSGTYLNVDPSTIRVNGASAVITATSATAGTFVSTASLAPGALTTIVASGRNAAGVESRDAITMQHLSGGPSISITAPADNQHFAANAADVQVSGTFIAPAGSHVSVNGVRATLAGETFSASVALGASGLTPIVARVSTPSNDAAMDSVRIRRFAAGPALKESYPANDAVGVSRGVAVVLLFTNALDATSVAAAVRLIDPDKGRVEGEVFVDRDAVTFAPHGPLRPHAAYAIEISTALKDLTGTPLGSAQRIVFTTAPTAPAAAPFVDDIATIGCFKTLLLTGRASPGSRVRLDVDSLTLHAPASDTGAFRFSFSLSGQSGFHSVRVREVASDGSLSAERALCFRLNCELPRVTSATLDRTGKKVVIEFSRPMDASTLIIGSSILFEPTLAGTVGVVGRTATVSLSGDVPPQSVTLIVRQTVKDLDGSPLAAEFTEGFTFETETVERGKGYVTGGILDATTGRPLPGATVVIGGSSGTTNDRGRYSRSLAEGAYTIEASANGFTTVWRQIVVPAGAGVTPLDIRLTRRAKALVDGGDTAVTQRVELTPAVASSAQVTAVGAQSLAGLLPLGWSPFASAEVRGDAFTTGSLTFSVGNVTSTFTLVRYDPGTDEWRVTEAVLSPARGSVAASITQAGHYALVYPDNAAHLLHPPPSRGGQALRGVADRCDAVPAQCGIVGREFTLVPRTIQPNGRAVATLITDGATQVYPSGTAVQAFIDEQLNLADGRVLVDPPFATDLLLYRTPAGQSAIADFHLAPTPRAASVLLRDGVERVRFVEYPGRLDRGTLLGAEGGRVPGDGNVTIDVPAGAAYEPLHARVTSMADADLAGLGSIAGFRAAGGFTLSLTRASATPAVEGVVDIAPSLLIPARATFVVTGTAAQVIVAELVTHAALGLLLRLVAIADGTESVSTGRIFVTRRVDSTVLPIDGIVRDGRYVVLVAQTPIAYAFGTVRSGAAAGLAIADARVHSGLGVVGVSSRGGLFVLPAPAKPASPFVLTPRSPATGDGVATVASAAPDAGAFVDVGVLTLAPQPPVLRSLTPAEVEIPAATALVVRAEFDTSIDASSILNAIRVTNSVTAKDVSGTTSAAGNSVSFSATELLRAGTPYTITVGATIRGANGAPFGRTVVKSFRTAALPAGNTVRPELIRITIPDANGRSVVSGLPGALPAGAQAVTVRRSRDFLVRYQATAAADGSFLFAAGDQHPSDRISDLDLVDLQVIDAVSRGIIAVVQLTPFAGADARSFVAPVGRDAVFLTADGVRVRVAAGAFTVPTLITATLASSASFAAVPKFDACLGFGAAVQLKFEGVAAKRIEIDVPVPPAVSTDGREWYAGVLGQSIRGPRVMIVDTAYAGSGRFSSGVAPAAGAVARSPVSNAGTTGSNLREYLLGVNRSGIYVFVNFQQTAGPVGFAIMTGLQAGYDLFWDTLEALYAAHFYLVEGRGTIAIPIVRNKPFQLVGVDASTGLESFVKSYDPVPVGEPGTTVTLPSPNADTQGPYPLLGSPFRVEVLDLTVKDVAIESVRDFKVTLKGSGEIVVETTLADVTIFNVTKGRMFTDLAQTSGTLGDRLVLLVREKDVDPDAPISLVFSEPLGVPRDADTAEKVEMFLRSVFQLELDKRPVEGLLRIRLDSERRVTFQVPASLKRGGTYRLKVSQELADKAGVKIGQTRDASDNLTAALGEPLNLEFKVRQPPGTVAEVAIASGAIRDQALNGNILFTAALAGGIYAFDISNPAAMTASTQPIGHHEGGATSYWAVAVDHHGRVYATGTTSMLGVVRSFRLDFTAPERVVPRAGATVSFVPGAAAAMDIASRVIATDRPEAIPRKLQILLQDRLLTPEPLSRTELKALPNVSVTGTYGDLEQFTFTSNFQPDAPYAVQRVTVENVDLDMRWSGEALHGRPAQVESVIGRPRDRFRIIHNDATYGVVSLTGYGVAVVDLNAMESNDAAVKPPGYRHVRELVRLTSGRQYRECGPLPEVAIPDLSFTPDAAITTSPGSSSMNVFALDPHRGILDLLVRPPDDSDASKPPELPDGVRCDERLSASGLVFRTLRNPAPASDAFYDHPRLVKLRALYEARSGRTPFARFNAAAPYRWTIEAADNHVVTSATLPGTVALGQRGSAANQKATRQYVLIPAHELGLLVVEIGGDSPAAPAIPGAPPLTAAHLVDVIWIPGGAQGVRTAAPSSIATVTDRGGRVLLVDLRRIDERWNEKGAIADDELFPTVRAILEKDATTPDPRIVWQSEGGLVTGTLAPIFDPITGFVFAGSVLQKTTQILSAVDPQLALRGDIEAAGRATTLKDAVATVATPSRSKQQNRPAPRP